MSADGAVSLGQRIFGRPDETTARVLRIAVGVALTFVFAELMGWTVPYLAPALALQFLVKPGPPPSVGQALVILVVIAVSSGFAVGLTGLMINHLAALLTVLGLLLFLLYYAHFRGAPGPVTLLTQLWLLDFPVLWVSGSPLATGFRDILLGGVAVAFAVTWIMHAIFPSRGEMAHKEEAIILEPNVAAGQAMVATLVVMPMLTWYIVDARQIMVALLMVVLVVTREPAFAEGQQVAMHRILGNLAGGVAAIIVYYVIILTRSGFLFGMVMLLACLLIAGRLTKSGRDMPTYVIGFTTFIVLVGNGLLPTTPGGAEHSFAARIYHILLGGTYAVAALSLLSYFGSRRRARAAANP